MTLILSSKQLLQADTVTIINQQITTIDLMEQIGKQCFDWIHNRLQGNPLPIHVICGTGKNGGNGLVIARALKKHGYNIKVYIVNCSNKRSAEFLENYNRLKELGDWPLIINSNLDLPKISVNDMVIDAIFGIGLNRTPQNLLLETIQFINKSDAYVLSIDMPSGLFADKTVKNSNSVVKAFQVLTFQTPKLAFFLPENEEYILNWDIIPIGLEQDFIQSIKTTYNTVEKHNVLSIYKLRSKFTHKGTYGHSLIVGGSFGKIGAVSLATKAAMRIGSGLVTAYIPKCGYAILQTSIPESMVEVDSENELQFFNIKTKPTAIGIGVGMRTSTKTLEGFTKFLKQNKIPLVIDADALNLISKNKELLKIIPKNSVLTPHPKELERLLGKWKNDYDKLNKIKKFTKNNALVLILKGANTIIAQDQNIYFNTTGNPALATAGSGDVLTGIITGLMAQNYSAFESSILGVYLHGLTADVAMQNQTYETFIASDIVDNLSNAFVNLLAQPQQQELEK